MQIQESEQMAGQAGISLSNNVSVGVLTQQINKQLCSSRSCNAARSDMVEGLLLCRRILHSWFLGQGVSEGSAAQAIRLCEGKYLQAQRRPTSWNRRGKFGVWEHCRYLWYKHAARLLRWCERKQFPTLVTEILRTHIYPTAGENDEETCACAIEAKQGSIPPICGGHCCNRQCNHGDRAVRDTIEAKAASEVSAKEGGCHNSCHSGDADTNAPQRNPKRHRATSPGFIDRNTRYVASAFSGCPLLRPLHKHPHPHRIVLLIASSRQYQYQGMNCQAVPSLPQAPSFKAPESCSILFVHIHS